MARKRRDKERDPSSQDRALGYAKAATATIAAAAFLNRHGLKDIQAINKTSANINSDLLGKKKTAENVLKAFDKRVGYKGEIYKQTRDSITDLNSKGNKVRVEKHSTKSATGVIKKANEMKREKTGYFSKHRASVQDKLYNDLLKEHNITDKKSQDAKLLSTIVRDGFHKTESADGIYKSNGKIKFNESFLKIHFDDLSSDVNISKEKVFGRIYDVAEQYKKDIDKGGTVYKKAEHFSKEIVDKMYDADNMSKFIGTRKNNFFNKVDKAIKDFTGFDVNTEDFMYGSKKATVKEVLEELNKEDSQFDLSSFNIATKNEHGGWNGNINLKDELNSLVRDNKKFADAIDEMEFGNGVRVKTNTDGTKHFYSTESVDEMVDKFATSFADSTLGNLFKVRDMLHTKKSPYVANFNAGTKGLFSQFEEGNDTLRMRNSYYSIGGSIYKIGEDNLEKMDDVGEIQLISENHGSWSRMVKDMMGSDRYIANASKNKVLKALDIQQSGSPDLITRIKVGLGKHADDEWDGNKLKKFIDIDSTKPISTDDWNLMTDGDVIKIADRVKTASEAFDNYTAMNQIDDDTLMKMLEQTTSADKGNDIKLTNTSEKLLRILLKGNIDEKAIFNQSEFIDAEVGRRTYIDFINALNATQDGEKVLGESMSNKYLGDMISKYFSNSDKTDQVLNINAKSNKIPMLGMDITRMSVLEIDEVVRREMIKEVMMNTSKGSSTNSMYKFIEDLDVSDNQKQALYSLNSWAHLQNDILSNDNTVISEAVSIVSNLEQHKENDKTLMRNIKGNLKRIIDDDYNIGSKPNYGNLSEQYSSDYNEYMAIKKSKLSDLLSDMNADTLWKDVKEVGQELVAGRNDIKNISLLTTVPYGMVARLGYAVEELGLGFSMNSSGSTLDLVKNIGMKRILPIMAAYHAYDYLDYESENLTGTSITAAGARGMASMDIGFRKGLDMLTMGTGSEVMNWFKEASVAGEYMTGERSFQNAEEREDWYENGYQAVRSSRFWSFGSSSEFRGSGIAYWQPNYLKRAESNWQEIGIYGSADEKFKHSLMPSLRHPLSTINYLMDPYWLEKKNMDLRPYPHTGKMFAEGTPWGAVLNPTIGEIIKPVKMLPEIRERLGNGHIDTTQLLREMNEREIAKSTKNDDMLIIEGTDIKNAKYTPYAYATPGYTTVNFNQNGYNLQGTNYESTVRDFDAVDNTLLTAPQLNDAQGLNGYIAAKGDIARTINNPNVREVINDLNSITTEIDLSGILLGLNNEVRSGRGTYVGTDLPRTGGVMINNNPVGEMISSRSDYYSRQEDYTALMTGKHEDYINDVKHSLGQMSGIYNFLGDMAFGEQSYSLRMAQAGDMYSFTRGFWDASVGGLGGNFMEIARRFFPHEDRTRPSYNPLANAMPTWLPQKFLKGDAYAALPKGEMRMPGAGYESINSLHADQFGNYGAFDRMKILGDIAPTSQEYKTWRKIAQQTVQDPNLIEEMKQIEIRAKRAGMDHDFYEYRYINNNLGTYNDTVKTVNSDGTVTLASGVKLSMAGIKFKGDASQAEKRTLLDKRRDDKESLNFIDSHLKDQFTGQEAVSKLIAAGDAITYKAVKDEVYEPGQEDIKAIIYKDNNMFLSADNINRELYKQGLAERDELDRSGIAYAALSTSGQEIIGGAIELVAHAKIPFIHNKILKVESAIESYKNEKVYGSSFKTWDNPYESFIRPAMYEQFRKSMVEEAMSIGMYNIYSKAMKGGNFGDKVAASIGLATFNPAATIGAGVGWAWKLRFGETAVKGSEIGNALGIAGWALNNADNPLKAAASFGIGAYHMSERLELDNFVLKAVKQHGPLPEDAKLMKSAQENVVKFLGKHADDFSNMKAGIIGATVGIGISILKNPDFDWNRLTGKWIPDSTKERWDLEEYFDRLEYVKYMGLYNEAARRAEMLEGSNVREVFSELDNNKKQIAKLQRKAFKVGNKYIPGTSNYVSETNDINRQIEELEMQKQALKGGEWTKSAIAYKKMAESTIYGLSEASTMDEILRSAPDQYRDFVTAFAEEKSEKKRKEILAYSSPQMKKLLQVAWGQEVDKQESNVSYFRFKKMPNMAWRGWKPNINLKHVHMKTIQNEGLAMSDFGFYESEKSKAAYHEAPDIENYDNPVSGIGALANLSMTMGGFGLGIDNVSVESTSAPGLWIMGDISRNVSEKSNLIGKSANNALYKIFL